MSKLGPFFPIKSSRPFVHVLTYGAHCTVTVTVVVCCVEPDLAVTAIVYAPAGVPDVLGQAAPVHPADDVPPPQPICRMPITISMGSTSHNTFSFLLASPPPMRANPVIGNQSE
jgi:hypothetical protein